jgi:hypothetical protein
MRWIEIVPYLLFATYILLPILPVYLYRKKVVKPGTGPRASSGAPQRPVKEVSTDYHKKDTLDWVIHQKLPEWKARLGPPAIAYVVSLLILVVPLPLVQWWMQETFLENKYEVWKIAGHIDFSDSLGSIETVQFIVRPGLIDRELGGDFNLQVITRSESGDLNSPQWLVLQSPGYESRSVNLSPLKSDAEGRVITINDRIELHRASKHPEVSAYGQLSPSYQSNPLCPSKGKNHLVDWAWTSIGNRPCP